jgi:hypothetical protein
LDACQAALAIAFEKLQTRQDPLNDAFEIIDDQQNVLMEVPFSEVLWPKTYTNVATNGHEIFLALQKCQLQIERSVKLKTEICAEFAQAKATFEAIVPICHTDRVSAALCWENSTTQHNYCSLAVCPRASLAGIWTRQRNPRGAKSILTVA